MVSILYDTREQQPWSFASQFNNLSDIQSVKRTTLHTGDYTLEGYEHLVCIERKKSVSELSTNLIQDRFWKELIRMQTIPHKFLLLEFSIDNILSFPVGSTVPKTVWHKIKIKPSFIMRGISQIQINYSVHVIFCNDKDNAQLIAFNILKQIMTKYKA